MTKVLICVGPGGVGKTTLAAAQGVVAARRGLKTLVLTIDPARRLAQTMGIGDSARPVKVPGADYAGELWAGIVDHRDTLDEFVKRASSQHAEKLFKNKLYQQLRTTLAGSQEFTALEKLYSSVREGGYDMVILDTPPAQHAVAFLQAPAKLAALFSEGIARWFRDPGAEKTGFVRKILNTGTRQILRVLEALTGAEFIRELADFFRQIESWQGRLAERTAAVQRLLTSEETGFCLVGIADRGRFVEIETFAEQLIAGGYRLDTVLFNRAESEWMKDPADEVPAELRDLHREHLKLVETQKERIAEFGTRLKGGVRVITLPEWSERIYDLKGLEKVADILEQRLK